MKDRYLFPRKIVYQMGLMVCKVSCPSGENIRVGSLACEGCIYNRGEDTDEDIRFVLCVRKSKKGGK